MPVLVTSADPVFGRRLVVRLLAEGGQVRAVSKGAVGALRQAGAIVAQADPDDVGRLEAAMAQVHTVVFLPPTYLAASAAEIEVAGQVAASAAEGAGVQRLIAVTAAGASPDALDPLRRALGNVEARLAAAPLPTLVLRPSFLDEPELRAVLAGTPLPSEVRAARIAPVGVADLAEVIVALDNARSTATEGHVVFGADGHAEVTVEDHVAAVTAATAQGLPAIYRPADAVPLLAGGLMAAARNEPGEVADAWAFAGLTPGEVVA